VTWHHPAGSTARVVRDRARHHAALGERGVDTREAGRILGVGYVVSGRARGRGERVFVTVELAETSEARIDWTDAEQLFRVGARSIGF